MSNFDKIMSNVPDIDPIVGRIAKLIGIHKQDLLDSKRVTMDEAGRMIKVLKEAGCKSAIAATQRFFIVESRYGVGFDFSKPYIVTVYFFTQEPNNSPMF
jgi:ribosome biogenesis GTPase A